MLKAGYGSLAYRGEWNIYDIEQVNYNLAVAPQGGLRIRKIVKNKYYGRIFNPLSLPSRAASTRVLRSAHSPVVPSSAATRTIIRHT